MMPPETRMSPPAVSTALSTTPVTHDIATRIHLHARQYFALDIDRAVKGDITGSHNHATQLQDGLDIDTIAAAHRLSADHRA